MPDLAAKLRFLQAPEIYGATDHALECIETHMSWVFLVGQRVYKLKKDVCFPFLDFTTLEAREFYCREEVRLNERLAPGVYLGVVALQYRDGVFSLVSDAALPASGETVDWLVLMQRLPLHQMLHNRLSTHRVGTQDIDGLVDLLGAFYRSAPIADLTEMDYLGRFRCEQAVSREILLRPQFQLLDAALLIDRLGEALALSTELLGERVSHHRVVDGHGDLRPDHVCLRVPPVVIDCIEFNPALRQVDPFDEVAYLGLECDMAGVSWIGPHLVSGMATALYDHPQLALLHFYTAHRALLRARLAMAHLLDSQPRAPEKWPPLAERYIERALAAMDDFTFAMSHDMTV